MVGTPDVLKGACPVWGGLGGNRPQGTAPSFYSMPGHHLSLPIGLALSLKETLANTLKVPYRSRSTLARRIVDQVAAALPTRAIRVATDGG